MLLTNQMVLILDCEQMYVQQFEWKFSIDVY